MASDIALEEPTNSEELSPDGASSPPGAHGVEPAPGIDISDDDDNDDDSGIGMASPKAPPSLSGFTLSPTPPAALTQRRCLEQEPSLVPKAVEERMALLELENTNLRQKNKVLYKQNSDYRELIQEYKARHEKANDRMDRIRAARDAIERITQAVTDDIKTYETARASVRRAERVATRDWKRFVDENASIGLDVEEVITDIIREHAVEITVYLYKEDRNII